MRKLTNPPDSTPNTDLKTTRSHSGIDNMHKDNIQNVFKKFDIENNLIMKQIKDY